MSNVEILHIVRNFISINNITFSCTTKRFDCIIFIFLHTSLLPSTYDWHSFPRMNLVWPQRMTIQITYRFHLVSISI
ncbi:unnamed protein product [Schistosoma curassoni]|uniref:Ovule protein n=1 Tax=Schistosoma curassoni TaxID=6186 RepID=A0A183KP33_9TREM|nr:unnamed protein product [Schistosoma curassoni]